MNEKRDIDYPLLFAVLGLVIFGAIVISSVSVYDSHRITRKLVETGALEEPNNWRFMARNLMQAGLGLFAMVLAIKTPYHFWKKHIKALAIVTTLLLMLVLVPGIGVKINGARGWFDIPGLPFSLQPTEFLKLILILSVSVFCAQYKNFLGSISEGFIPFIGIIIIPTALVLLQPDLGALVIILPIVLGIYFIAGGNVKIIFYLGIIALVLSSFMYAVGRYDVPENRNHFSYIYDRINTFIQPNMTAIEENTMHHQNKQALIAIGSGGFLGLGFGKSVQKYGYLPEPQGDFIFSVITEEWGFLGAFVIIAVYIFIIFRGFIIASLCENLFGKYVAFGITMWISWQMIINISVNLNIFPNTGLTLPFLSYGGSSLLTMLVSMGILLSISRDIDSQRKKVKNLVISFLLRSIGRGSRKLGS